MLTPSTDQIFGGHTNDNVELLKAWAGSTLAYAIFQTGASNLTSRNMVENLIIAGIVCGMAFVLHELAHRVVARGYGAEAHFVANNGWLVLSIVLALAGIFVAAPGAVWHRGLLTRRQGGLIALAGPVTNMVLSVLFFIALCLVVLGIITLPELAVRICYVGFTFNAWIGLFNMIPAGPFDGAKVLAWSPLVFGITVAVGLGLAFGLSNEQVLLTLLQMVRG
ncbi:MAG TPA: site-2 protease family protein [Roseiflexaceae bacterium]|nr:site-2 protease family protein [Roseiflexaceae bacterium]